MIKRLFNSPYIVWQTGTDDGAIPNEAIAVCVDNGGTICMQQGKSEIVLNKETIPDLINTLKAIAG